MNPHNKDHGFTVVELAVVLIIFGFAASTMMLALKTYTEQQRVQRTNDAISLSMNAISTFVVANQGRFPCPASLTARKSYTSQYYLKKYRFQWSVTQDYQCSR